MIRFFGVTVSLAVLMGLIWFCFADTSAAAAYVKPQPLFHPVQTQPTTQPEEETPCQLPYANIYARRLVSFDGPFYEDQNAEELVGVAALELENTGNKVVEYVEAIVYQEHRQLRFEATYIPPGGRVLVLEKDAQLYDMERIVDFQCPKIVTATVSPQNMVQVLPDGACNLVVTNLSQQAIGCVRVFYKQYYEQDDLLLGGVTYSLVLTNLQPGESRRIAPYHFATDYSRIVAVIEEP